MRIFKQRGDQSGKRSDGHYNSNQHSFRNWGANKYTNMHGHLARSLHSASSPRPLESTESQRVRDRFALEEDNDREWEAKRQACVEAMARFRAGLKASREAEFDSFLEDTDSSIANSTTQLSQLKNTTFSFTTKGVRGIKARGSAGKRRSLDVRVHSSPAVASLNIRRQNTILKLMAKQGTHFSGTGKARVRIRKTPISVRFRHSPCRSNGITLKTQLCRLGRTVSASRKLLNHDSHSFIGNTPAPDSIVTAEIVGVEPSLQESMANKGHRDFTFADWFTVAMFVLQYLIWITLGCLFVSVLGS
ncbi:hypothetical protein NW767_013429 [Fusarium falciforme]|nr:hypothetical protein NW767_013429 [Fusarium falciforme]